jgi:hypothetical protein
MSGIAAAGTCSGTGPREPGSGAAHIYGVIATAAILDATVLGATRVHGGAAVSVVVTLLVYWLAEEYAEVLGEQVEGAIFAAGGIIPKPWRRPGADEPWRPFCAVGRSRAGLAISAGA